MHYEPLVVALGEYGRVLAALCQRVSAFSRSVKLDVGALASGVYLVRTTSGSQSNTRTFTVR